MRRSRFFRLFCLAPRICIQPWLMVIRFIAGDTFPPESGGNAKREIKSKVASLSGKSFSAVCLGVLHNLLGFVKGKFHLPQQNRRHVHRPAEPAQFVLLLPIALVCPQPRPPRLTVITTTPMLQRRQPLMLHHVQRTRSQFFSATSKSFAPCSFEFQLTFSKFPSPSLSKGQ